MKKVIIFAIIATMYMSLMYINTTCACACEKVYHSKATIEAEQRGLEVNNGWLCWADTHEEVEPDADGYLPYEEFIQMETPNADIGLCYDEVAGKQLHDKCCKEDHKIVKCKKCSKCKKCNKLVKVGKKCKKHTHCKKCKRF